MSKDGEFDMGCCEKKRPSKACQNAAFYDRPIVAEKGKTRFAHFLDNQKEEC